ncbi:MAG TPA: hypothetical protein VN783_16310 [Thermoanaerobaculia bacterium]|nr:hypothetical protein [Thermoanaerobaculia bacterium]
MSASSLVDLLPGLYVAIVAVLVLVALRRWWDAIPHRAVAGFALVLVVLFGRVLFGGDILLPLDGLRGEAPFRLLAPTDPHGNLIQGDLIQLIAPLLAEVRRAAGDGRFPLWNERVGAGMPLLANPQAQALQPLVWLAAPFPLAVAAGVTAAFRVFFALAFAFLFLRRQGLGDGSDASALCGALGFGLGGFVLLWLGWPMANTAAWMPAVLYALALWDERGRRRDLLLLAVALFGLLTGGHPETIAYALLCAAAFLGLRALSRPKGSRRALALGAAWALGIAAGAAAPALVPAALYLPDTARAAILLEPPPRSSPASPAGREGDGLARATPIFAPNAFGNSRFVSYWGPKNTNEDASGFAGTVLLLAAGLAFVPARRRFPQERLWLGSAAIAAAEVVFFGRGRLLLVLCFSLAILGACTLERFRRGEGSRLAAILWALGLGGILVWAYLAHPFPGDPERLAILRFGWLRWQARFLGAGLLLLAVARGRWFLPVLLAPLVAAELLLCHLPANPPAPRRLAFPVVPAIRFLEEHASERMAALGPALPPNLATLYGLRDLRIYDPIAPAAWERLAAPLVVSSGGEVPRFGNPTHPLYPRLGVRWLLTGPEIEIPALRLAFRDGSARIYEVPAPASLLFAAGRAAPLGIVRSDAARLSAEVPPPLAAGAWKLSTGLFQDGGWRVLAAGRPLATSREAGALLGAAVPKEAERIDLLYRPRGFLVGMLLAALALAAATGRLLAPADRG